MGGEKDTDAEVTRAIMGDRQAFHRAFEAHKGIVIAVIRRNLAEADLDDELMAVYERALNGVAKLRDPATFPRWLGQITRHYVVDHIRRRARAEERTRRPPRPALRSLAEVMAVCARVAAIQEIRTHLAVERPPVEEDKPRAEAVRVLRRLYTAVRRPRPSRELAQGMIQKRLEKLKLVAPFVRAFTLMSLRQIVSAPSRTLPVADRNAPGVTIGFLAARPDPRRVVDDAIRQIEGIQLDPGLVREYLRDAGFTHAGIDQVLRQAPREWRLDRVLSRVSPGASRQRVRRGRRRRRTR